jgi:hypothetical protein
MADPVYAERHKEMRRKHKAQYRSKPTGRRRIRAANLKLLGWTIDHYETALHEQGNRCAICQEIFTATPHADHKHVEPPIPRGLLCKDCNFSIGFLKDSPELLENAAAYLRKFSGTA